MWVISLGLLAFACGALGAPLPACPKTCLCTPVGDHLEARCPSLDFLRKLPSEQADSIAALDLSNSFITKAPNLSGFGHLRRLSLASNMLRYLSATYLPKSLEHLDLSRNSLTHPPLDLHHLPALKEVSLLGNPISCDCESLRLRDVLLHRGVAVAKAPKCESPENLRGKSWLTVSCKNVEQLFEDMQGDEPYEGSGSGDVGLVAEEITEKSDRWEGAIEQEFIRMSTEVSAPEGVAATEAPELEGSGDGLEVIPGQKPEASTESPEYDYEDEDIDYNDELAETSTVSELPAVTVDMSLLDKGRVKACNFNCSTPSPLEASNETALSPAPGLFEGLGILAGDLGFIGHRETTTTTTTEPPATPPEVPVEQRKIAAVESDKNATTTDTELLDKDANVGTDKENIAEEPAKQSNSTFIFLSVLLLVIICLVVYAIVKKRAMQRNRQFQVPRPDEKEASGEEMELLTKPAKPASQNDKPNGTHETVPLMNGHNESPTKNDEEGNEELKPEDEDEDVELRPKKIEQQALTPETKRVTIKASEIPNSTPKTPILVTRHLNSDGSIVTTPNIDQHVM